MSLERERQILYDLTHMWNLKKKTLQKQITERWLPEVEGGEKNG